jgi:hypothetical protein
VCGGVGPTAQVRAHYSFVEKARPCIKSHTHHVTTSPTASFTDETYGILCSTPHHSLSLSLHHGGKASLIWESRSYLNVQHQQCHYLHPSDFQQDPGKNALQPGRPADPFNCHCTVMCCIQSAIESSTILISLSLSLTETFVVKMV